MKYKIVSFNEIKSYKKSYPNFVASPNVAKYIISFMNGTKSKNEMKNKSSQFLKI